MGGTVRVANLGRERKNKGNIINPPKGTFFINGRTTARSGRNENGGQVICSRREG